MIRKIIADGNAEKEFLKEVEKRNGETDKRVSEIVADILENVRTRGDEAVKEYTLKFDGRLPDCYEVPRDVINDALTNADEKFTSSLLTCMENITKFHSRQKEQSFIDPMPNGCILGQRVRGLDRVGLYVPGGTAALSSSLLMNVVPAKIAEVGEIIMMTPPGKDGKPNADILTAAAVAGVDRVFMAGGAQAIAAMAYGTESVPKVDKVVGPGNIFVATAKKMVYGTVDIDSIAGPSEILIIADETADPVYLAADLMSQAEHDRLSSAIIITDSEDIADRTIDELARQAEFLSRKDIIKSSLENYGAVIVADNIGDAVDLANSLAPEHLEIQVKDPMQYLGRLNNAGSVFMGKYSPEPLGDYYAGPNHILPTGGTAKFFSPLSVNSFTKRSQFIYYTEQALLEAKDDIVRVAESEGLTAHAHAVKVRFEK
ncbi:MAG: histidinol dehydrogenase [Ruminococcus sp.]|nr:histidinol dehydrogenase [Ruminococcus sp.]